MNTIICKRETDMTPNCQFLLTYPLYTLSTECWYKRWKLLCKTKPIVLYERHMMFSSFSVSLSWCLIDLWRQLLPAEKNYTSGSIPLISFHRIMSHCLCELKRMWTVIITSSLSLQTILCHLEALWEHLACLPQNYDNFRGNDEVLLGSCRLFLSANPRPFNCGPWGLPC